MSEKDQLGRYELRRELGRGAMGVVYEAYDPMIKRVVALKTIRADRLEPAEAASIVARFRREAEAAGRLHHPNIVSIFDFGEDGGTSFIAMEFVEGRDLKSRFDAGERFSTADAVRLTAQILDALQYSHEHGVIHRDIKPANVFVKDDGSVKVADFGIAHLESSSLTQAGTVMGTPSSMSPEQVLGLPVDARTDVFSTGVVLYQFVTGERPFGGAQSTTTMQKVLKEDPLPPSTLNVQLPDLMDEILRKALAKKPEERYASAAEFAKALRTLAMPAPSRGAAERATASTGYDGDATVVASTLVRPAVAPAASAPAPAATAPAAAAPAASPPPKPAYAASSASTSTATSARPRSQLPAVLIVVGIAALAIAAGLWWWMQSVTSQAGRHVSAEGAQVAAAGASAQAPGAATAPAATAPAAAAASPAPAASAGSAPAAPVAAGGEPGTLLIAAAGYADANDPRYKGDPAKLAGDLRADARGQLVEKALGLLVERKSLAANYDALNAKLVARSGDFIRAVVGESEPVVGASGVATMTTVGVVNVKAVQKSLNEMTRAERLDVIRANGDPRVSIAIAVRDAGRSDIPPQRSSVAENLLAERIRSFGFRVVNDGTADVSIAGEAAVKRLSVRLEASGVVVTKYALSSWTLKAVDRTTGEEIYHATALPKGSGSWASEEEALKAIGAGVADAFSRDFFLQHASATTRRVTLVIEGLPQGDVSSRLAAEFVGLPAVIAIAPRSGAGGSFELELAGSGPLPDLVASGILAPLNAKFGKPCLVPGASSVGEVRARFDPSCNDPAVLGRLDTNPPAGLYGAPESRRKSVLRDAEALKKLSA